MGALFNGSCFASVTDATHAALSHVVPVIGSGTISTTEYTAGAWSLVTRDSGGIVSSVPIPSLDFAPCSPLDAFLDGSALGWGVAMVWLVAFGVVAMRRGVGGVAR